MDEDLRAALSFTNERHVRELLGDSYMSVVGQYTDELDRVHEGLMSKLSDYVRLSAKGKCHPL